MNNVLIIGYGNVGQNLDSELKLLHCDKVDKHKNINKTYQHHKIGLICVDTPMINDYDLDITEVRNSIIENDCDIYVIKSTCPVGTVDKLKKETGKRIIFSPEYYGTTPHCNNFNFDFTILGGDKQDCIEVIQLLQSCYDGRHQFRITDSRTAELAKFMENSFLATKVSFCCDFYKACKKLGLNYEELRELFILDERVGASHTFVNETSPYWNSHCLDKDVPHIAYTLDMPVMTSICKINEKDRC